MKLSLPIIHEYLLHHFPMAKLFGNTGYVIDSVKTHDRYDAGESSSTLYIYIYNKTTFPKAPVDQGFYIASREAELEGIENYIALNSDYDPYFVAEIVQDAFNRHHSVESGMLSQIKHTFSSGDIKVSYGKLMEICKDHIDAPIIVFDFSLKVLAHSEDPLFDEGFDQFTQLNGVTYMRTDSYLLNRDAGDGQGPVRRDTANFMTLNTDAKQKVISCYVSARKDNYARIVVLQQDKPLKKAWLPIVDTLATAVLYLIMMDRAKKMEDNNFAQEFIQRVLSGETVSDGFLRYSLLVMGWQRYEPYTVYVLFHRNADLTRLKELTVSLINVFGYGKTVIYHDQIVFIVREKDRTANLETHTMLLESFLSEQRLICGQSLVSNDFGMLKTYYAQANCAVGIILNNYLELSLLRYERIISDYAVLMFLKTHSMQHYAHPAAIALMEYDQKNGSDLVQTVYMYLMNDKKHAVCAKKMFISRSTFQYHLYKALDIIGDLDLDDERTRLNFIVSLKMVMLTL